MSDHAEMKAALAKTTELHDKKMAEKKQFCEEALANTLAGHAKEKGDKQKEHETAIRYVYIRLLSSQRSRDLVNKTVATHLTKESRLW